MKMKTNTRAAVAGVIGSILEIYDFVLYGALATVIGSLFFPSNHPELSLIATLGVFAAGYLARPLGAIFFGHIGDRIGRRKALALSIFFMAIPTFGMGVLPSYDSLGIAAPIILITLRMLQGVGISGEFNGAIIFLIEHFGTKRAGFAGSLINCGSRIGACLALLTGALCLHPALPTWSWRVPFILGSLLAFVGLYIRLSLDETPLFKKEVEGTKNVLPLPILTTLRQYPLSVLCTFIGAAFEGSLTTATGIYVNIFLTKIVNIPIHDSLLLNSIGYFYYILLAPIAGLLADRIGYTKCMIIGAVGIFSFAYPVFSLFQTGYYPYIILAQIVLFSFTGIFTASFNPMITQLFPTNVRYSGVAFGYNSGIALVGGAMPVIVTTLIYWTGNKMMPSFYLMVGSIIGILVAWGGHTIMKMKKNIAPSLLVSNTNHLSISSSPLAS